MGLHPLRSLALVPNSCSSRKADVFAFFKEHTKQQVNKVDLGLRLEIAIRRAS